VPVPNSVPRFVVGTQSVKVATVSSANTNRDGTGTIVDIFTAGAQGTLVELIRVIATGTTTAGQVRIFIHDGSTYMLYDEIAVTAITPSATVQAFEAELIPTKPLVIPTGFKLAASTHNAETFRVFATGGDY